MKYLKKIILLVILAIILFLFSGCSYFESQKEYQKTVERGLEYINTKYSVDSSFKKYERKDIKSNGGSVCDSIVYDICGNNLGTGTSNMSSRTVELKDGTKIYYEEIDTRQGKEIREDFEKYFYNEIIGTDYTNERIISFSEKIFGKTPGERSSV